jgi:hypothetical protein
VDAQQWLHDFEARATELRQRSAALAEGLAGASATVSAPDGSVTVTIGAGGGLENLELGRRAAEHSPARLTKVIMDTVRRGQREAATKVGEVFAPLGGDSEAMRLISRLVPDRPGREADAFATPGGASDDLDGFDPAVHAAEEYRPRQTSGPAAGPEAGRTAGQPPGARRVETHDEVDLW